MPVTARRFGRFDHHESNGQKKHVVGLPRLLRITLQPTFAAIGSPPSRQSMPVIDAALSGSEGEQPFDRVPSIYDTNTKEPNEGSRSP
jgi:hypothetical protein